MMQFLGASLVGVALIIIAALAFTGLRITIRRWLNR